VTRRTVRVELDRFSATLTGPRVAVAVDRAAVLSMRHPTRRHRTGAIQVRRCDLDDVLAALEMDGQLVAFVDRAGAPVAFGGLLGGVA
jgi:hypothetical protein